MKKRLRDNMFHSPCPGFQEYKWWEGLDLILFMYSSINWLYIYYHDFHGRVIDFGYYVKLWDFV